MKMYIFFFVLLLFTTLFCSQSDSTQCDGTLIYEGVERAISGGAYKPSANAPGEYFRALVVYAQFEDETGTAGFISTG